MIRKCNYCLYPENAKPVIQFDEKGVCSGCNYNNSRVNINWRLREKMFIKLVNEMKKKRRELGNYHDCIIPVGGGKDSTYQVWLLKNKYNLKPLLVNFDHSFNTEAGVKNLENLVRISGFDLVKYTAGIDSVQKISKLMLQKVGDLTWHYHAGIRTFPFQVACDQKIPFLIYGEHGYSELTGMMNLNYIVEHTYWSVKEHCMRGYAAENLLKFKNISKYDIKPYVYPDLNEIKRQNIRGIYLSNYFKWNQKKQSEIVIKSMNFKTLTYKRDRTPNLFSKIEDHANDVHDYLKFLKFGYGRGTDDCSMEIRHNRLSKNEGEILAKNYDKKIPRSLDFYLEFLKYKKKDFYFTIEKMAETHILKGLRLKKEKVNDFKNINKKLLTYKIKDYIFSNKNRHLYYNPKNPPKKIGDKAFDEYSESFYGY